MRLSTQTPNLPFRCVGLFYVALVTLGLFSGSIDGAEYNYPYRDPYLATTTTAILGFDGATPRADSTIFHVPGLPGRNNVPTLEGRGNGATLRAIRTAGAR